MCRDMQYNQINRNTERLTNKDKNVQIYSKVENVIRVM